LLIIGSGSGRTASLLTMAGQARNRGTKILLFTTDATSPLAELADQQVIIPAPLFRMADGARDLMSVQPLGTLFEQSLLILCDCLILRLMQRTGVDAAQMFKRHANLE
jgi:6-phospho-3-hexuloisomerase